MTTLRLRIRRTGAIQAGLLALLAACLVATAVAAQERQVARKTPGDMTRFASLRADDVNVRAGPGVRYPVKWKFVQRNMPRSSAGLMIFGVRKINSSVRLSSLVLLRNRMPRPGMSPRNGTLVTFSDCSCW